MSAASDGLRVASLCLTKPHTKSELIQTTGWTDARVSEAIAWCRSQRQIARNPFMVLNVNGRWEYGWRHKIVEVIETVDWNLGYCLTRLGNASKDYTHVLNTTASLAKDSRFTSNVRRDITNGSIMLNGVVASLDMAKVGLQKILVP